MNEVRKYSMIAGSINSTLKVQGQKEDRMGGDPARLLCKELVTVGQSTVRTHPLLCGGWFLPSYLKSNSGLHWDHSGSLKYLFLQSRNNEPGVWLLPWKCRRQTGSLIVLVVEPGECCCFCIGLYSQNLPSQAMHECILCALQERGKHGVVLGPVQSGHLKSQGDLSTKKLQVCHVGWGSCRRPRIKLHPLGQENNRNASFKYPPGP